MFGTALSLLKCLRDRAVLEWVTPPHRPRPEFDPTQFVTSADTLYSLSMEGPGAAGPLVAALADHVCMAAVEVSPAAVRRALTVELRPFAPDVAHAASSTARLAASSIVGST